MKKLPVFASVGEVLSGVTRHYFQMLLAAWPALIPLLLMFALVIWILIDGGLLGGASYSREFNETTIRIADAAFDSHPFGSLLINLLWAFTSAVAAVRWHRLVLLGEGTAGTTASQVLRVEDSAYIVAIIKTSLVFVLIGGLTFAAVVLVMKVPGFKDMEILSFVAISLSLIFFATLALRFSLVLPDAAVGAGGRLRAVFKASAGNGIRLLATVVLLLLFALVASLVVMIVVSTLVALVTKIAAGLQLPAIVAALIAFLACYLYFLMTQVTVLSVAYRELVGLPSETESGAALPGSLRRGPTSAMVRS